MKMLKVLKVVLPVLLLATLLVSGCSTILVPKDGETETGETETRKYDIGEFTRVDINSAFSYEIEHADTYSVSITARSNLFDDINVTMEGQTLIVGMEPFHDPWTTINISPNPKVVITMPQLRGLDSSGATGGIVAGFSSSENLDITASGASEVELAGISADNVIFDLSGASEVTGDIEAENVELDLSGASTIQLKGSADSITAEVSGACDLLLAGLEAKDASIVLSGASNGSVNLDGTLDADLSGASTLEYTGEPTLGIMDITGSSVLKRSSL